MDWAYHGPMIFYSVSFWSPFSATNVLDGDANRVSALLAGGTARLVRVPSRPPAAGRELQHV